MPALVPTDSRSTLTPSEVSSSDATGQMPNTPIEAVMVAGWATIDVGAHRGEIAAGGRDVAHRDDHRLAGRRGRGRRASAMASAAG